MFEVFTAVKIHVEIFWVMMLCSVVVGYQRFGGHAASITLKIEAALQLLKRWYPTTALQNDTTQRPRD
jgi:hypothetical protein